MLGTHGHEDRPRQATAGMTRAMSTGFCSLSMLVVSSAMALATCLYNDSPYIVRVAHIDKPSKSIKAEHLLTNGKAICFARDGGTMLALYSNAVPTDKKKFGRLHTHALGQLGRLYVDHLSPRYHHIIPSDWIFELVGGSGVFYKVIRLDGVAPFGLGSYNTILDTEGVPMETVFDAWIEPRNGGRFRVVPGARPQPVARPQPTPDNRTNVNWAVSRAHDKGCWNQLHRYHVRCEKPDGSFSTQCSDMPVGTFRGKAMQLPPRRLPDRTWTEVAVACR